MLQRLGVRGKILAVVAVPVLVLLLAAGFISYGAVQDLNDAQNSEQLIDTLDRARDLEADLQAERYNAVNFVHTISDTTLKLTTARSQTNTSIDDLQEAVAASSLEEEEQQALLDDVYEAIQYDVAADDILPAARSLDIARPGEVDGESTEQEIQAAETGWVAFPTDEEVAAMQQDYTDAAAAVDAIADSLPEDSSLDVPLAAISFRLGFESTTATTLFVNPQEYQANLQSIFQQVDGDIQALLGSSEELAQNEVNAAAVASLLSGQDAVAQLPQLRAAVTSAGTSHSSLMGFYSDLIATIVFASNDVAVAMTDRELVAQIQAYGDLDALIENMYYEEVTIERLIRTGAFLPGEAGQLRNYTARTDISLAEAQRSSAGVPGAEPVPDYGASASSNSGDQASFVSVRTSVLNGLDSSLVGERNNQWNNQVAEEVAAYAPLRDEMWRGVQDRAETLAQQSLTQTILTSIIVLIVVVLSLIVALLIARRIVVPLRRLTTTATAVRQDLPRLVERVAMPGETVDVSEVQIPVESQDEIGRLAEAFNGVNAATIEIASEQAALRGSISEMFVNVARRDQVLLNRQLSSIDEMERSEDNPDTLTKLFALDHLATRMRRNSESLLVLAGIDTGRRLRRPMPLSDVIRTASSEIELYERVQLELDADPSMLGHSALTAAHLFAELLENATVFSDPGTPVVVRTVRRDGDVVVEIEDSGIGMTESELGEANNRVASTAASEILGAQRLGLFVVGRIARRVGARVRIESQEGKGTLAVITMPPSLFASDSSPQEHVSSNAVDESMHAPAALVSHDEANEISDPTPPVGAAATAAAGAYIPTAIQEGTSLSGRGGEAAPAEDNSIDALIAADAAEAPVAEPTRPEELTGEATAAGLPARRRREAPAPADAQREQQSVVGLPAQATAAQLSALEAESAGGFTPAVSASEVSPQSAEERASMFRGFRSRRDSEAVEIDPEKESLGQAARRGASAVPALEPDEGDGVGAGAVAAGAAAVGAAAFFGSRAGDSTPSAQSAAEEPAAASAPEVASDASAPSAASAPGPDHLGAAALAGAGAAAAMASDSAPSATSADEPAYEEKVPTFSMPKLDVTPASPEPVEEPQPAAPEEPAIIPGFELDDDFSAPTAASATEYDVPMTIPSLEADEDEFVAPAPADEVAVESAYPEGMPDPVAQSPYSGVEQVSLGDEQPASPDDPHSPHALPWAAAGAAGAFAAAHSEPSAPSYEQVAPEPVSAEPTSPEPVGYAQQPHAYDQPVGEAHAPVSPVSTPQYEATSTPSMDELIQSAVDEDQDQRGGFFGRLFGRGKRQDVAPIAGAAVAGAAIGGAAAAHQQSTPAAGSFEPGPEEAAALSGFTPAAQEPVAPSAPAAPAAQAPEPAYAPSQPSAPAPWEQAPTSFAPAPEAAAAPTTADWGQSQPAAQQPAERPAEIDTGGVYSPDQLAKAQGWEAAGASALQAAEPEAAVSYQPVIQQGVSEADSDTEMTSAVFSELSSLAAERPKVEKTRSGLQKRRGADAKPVEVKPIEEEVAITPVERDADAVRSRFSSFYSGTQRARDDAAAFDRQTEPAEATE